MGGVVFSLTIKIGILLITKDMIQMGSLFIPIKIFIKEWEWYQNPYKLVNQMHLLRLLGIHPTSIYQ